MMLWRRL